MECFHMWIVGNTLQSTSHIWFMSFAHKWDTFKSFLHTFLTTLQGPKCCLHKIYETIIALQIKDQNETGWTEMLMTCIVDTLPLVAMEMHFTSSFIRILIALIHKMRGPIATSNINLLFNDYYSTTHILQTLVFKKFNFTIVKDIHLRPRQVSLNMIRPI